MLGAQDNRPWQIILPDESIEQLGIRQFWKLQ